MSENKTKPTSVEIGDFLQTVSDKRRQEAHTLIDLMSAISGEKPVMWEPSIIGFGAQHYKSEAGREGDMGILGFSPRKTSLTIYFYEGFDRYGEELGRLGKHKLSRSCLYVNKLADIDLKVLESMLQSSYQLAASKLDNHPSTVDTYISSVPQSARPQFDELRQIVKSELSDAHEVLSYGVVGYKPDPNKRATVFISGWKDHVAIYPVPKDEKLRQELEPYIHSKGTLWFALGKPLPTALIRKAVRGLS